MEQWRSRHKYQTPKGLGHILEMGRGFVVETHRGMFSLDHIYANAIKVHESYQLDRGRPARFKEETELHAITLPTRLWRRLPLDPSQRAFALARLIEEM